MKKINEEENAFFSRKSLIIVNFAVLLFFLLLITGVYLLVKKKSKGQLIFPAGLNYLSPKTTVTPKQTPLYDYVKLVESTDWATFKGKKYAFSFQYPKVLTPLTFIDDPSEAVTFKVNDLPPQLSLMFLVETISNRDKTLVGKPEEFVRGYWRYFSGLKGLKSITSVKNDKGLQGFKAVYILKSGGVTEKYFFTIEGDSDHLLHIANIFGGEGSTSLFNRILNSVNYGK